MTEHVGILGATSMVGQALLPRLVGAGVAVVAYSRREPLQKASFGIEFRRLGANEEQETAIADWICLAPIWTLPQHFPLLQRCGVRRIVALSSTSIFAKRDSPDPRERELAEGLERGERQLAEWSAVHGVDWIVLRPTLIYGEGQDRNVCEIARIITRFGFFPLLGRAGGKRQPVHVQDIAAACAAALQKRQVRNRAYNLSGGETLSYRDMVARIFAALGKKEWFFSIPLPVFRIGIACLRLVPRFRNWTPAMAERMNADLIFDHTDAAQNLDYLPRPFLLQRDDLP